jgi:hypothetical protein
MTHRRLLGTMILAAALLPLIAAQEPKPVLPVVVGGAMPLYPPLARAARIQGTVHVEVKTDGKEVVNAQSKDGHRLLAIAAEDNAKTWRFQDHKPMVFTVTYRYRLEADGDVNNANPTVTLRLPMEVDVATGPTLIMWDKSKKAAP